MSKVIFFKRLIRYIIGVPVLTAAYILVGLVGIIGMIVEWIWDDETLLISKLSEMFNDIIVGIKDVREVDD